MMEKLRSLDLHYADVEARLGAPETYDDPALVAKLNKEQRELEPLVTAYRSWCKAGEDLRGAEALLSDPDFKDLAQEEMAQAKEELERLEQLIRELLLPVLLFLPPGKKKLQIPTHFFRALIPFVPVILTGPQDDPRQRPPGAGGHRKRLSVHAAGKGIFLILAGDRHRLFWPKGQAAAV